MTKSHAGEIIDQLGRPARDLRISVLDRCNFRCPYCMPEDQFPEGYQFLPRKQWLNFDEIERLSRIFIKLGVSKLRITGGEPLLRPDLPELIARLIKLEGIDDLALTTNGTLLSRMASELSAAGLHRVTVSLDSMDNKVFSNMSGGRGSLGQGLPTRGWESRSTRLFSAVPMTTRCWTCSSIFVAADTLFASLNSWTWGP